MSDATLSAVLRSALGGPFLGDSLQILWHAGEPMVAPVAFYRTFVGLANDFKPSHLKLTYAIQTNATLVDDEWCRFFKEHDVSIGVSIDGPKFLHDSCRKSRSGRGTFDKVMAGISKLREHGLDFGVITVLTRESLRYPDELLQFYEDFGFRKVCFNVEEVEGIHHHSSLQNSDSTHLVSAFFERFWEGAAKSATQIWVREFEERLAWIFRDTEMRPRNHLTEPFAIVSVDSGGNFSTFSPELLTMRDSRYGDFVLGNLRNGDVSAALETEKFRQMQAEVHAGVERCRRECEYFTVCEGGSPSNKLDENGTFNSTETLYCRFKVKALTEVLLKRVESRRDSKRPLRSAT